MLTAATLSACASAGGAGPAETAAAPATCDADKAVSLLGREAAPGALEGARRAAGARALRVIRSGSMVTMDYRPDRLNVELAEDGRVRRIHCG